MKSINIMYLEMKDLHGSIEMMKEECKKVDKEWDKLLIEIKDATFNASQGAQLYKKTQEFLQERRLLKMQMEELKNQYIILGGDKKLKELEEFQDITKVGNKEGIKRRKADYFGNFREDIKEEVSEMYHVIK
ncbi:hypothetical protein [Staphylococcus phage VB-SauS-SA2]|nr:hypothetical protein [Staphylococcus phage VB-SauS-SA2]